MTVSQPKIFGIGLNKTGTTTLGQCGKFLGFRCTSCDRDLLEDFVLRSDFTRIEKKINDYDLFEDWPWPLIYKQLDQRLPGSKFILTVRKSEDAWLKSIKNHAMRTHPMKHCRKLAYGFNYPHKHEKDYIEFYRRHNDSVRSYFKNRSGDFIELCWESGDGFDKLCGFLNCNAPDVPFPHANKGADQKVGKMRVLINTLLSNLNI